MKTRKALRVLFILLALLVGSLFLFRNTVLNYAFEKVKTKLHNNKHVSLSARYLAFDGIQDVIMQDITVVPDSADTLLTVARLKVNLALLDLLTGNLGFDEIQCDTFKVHVFNQAGRNNVSFLMQRKNVTDTTQAAKSKPLSYSELLQSVAGKVFRVLNTRFILNQFKLNYTDSIRMETIQIPLINYDKEQLTGQLISVKEKNNDTLFFSGEVLKRNHTYKFRIVDQSADKNYLPFLNIDKKLRARFEVIEGTINYERIHESIKLTASINATDIHINHWRISDEDVILKSIDFNGNCLVTDNSIMLDSASVIKLNRAAANVYVAAERSPQQKFAIKVNMPETEADSFFNSLPGGMFRTLKGIKASGKLSYHLNFEIDSKEPDQLIFDATMKKKNFRIVQYGAENYSRINEPFTFDAMDGDRLVRKIEVGPANPVFTPLDQISNYLKYAVLTSEDGSFMYHRGFNEDAFRQSIVTNYKAQRFLRGGSTITMQLVKNCFLSRDKTVSRKAEEALIVWLIENLGLVSKDRMLEVYLNVIEWGPDVYGIGEASGFYFGKQPRELNLPESIYLASIIPHPKYFKYSFDSTGTLKPYLSGYYRLVSSKMLSREWITPEDTTGLQPSVKLTGPARNFVLPPDTFSIPIDSLLQQDIEQL